VSVGVMVDIHVYVDGGKYEGEWKDDKRDGRGN
jgi:hypothetical protein